MVNNYGEKSQTNEWYIKIYDQEYMQTYTADPTNTHGLRLSIDLFTEKGSTTLPEGTFSYVADPGYEIGFYGGYTVMTRYHYNIDYGWGIGAGSVTISKNGEEYTIVLDMTATNGAHITGGYVGPISSAPKGNSAKISATETLSRFSSATHFKKSTAKKSGMPAKKLAPSQGAQPKSLDAPKVQSKTQPKFDRKLTGLFNK